MERADKRVWPRGAARSSGASVPAAYAASSVAAAHVPGDERSADGQASRPMPRHDSGAASDCASASNPARPPPPQLRTSPCAACCPPTRVTHTRSGTVDDSAEEPARNWVYHCPGVSVEAFVCQQGSREVQPGHRAKVTIAEALRLCPAGRSAGGGAGARCHKVQTSG